MKKILSVSIALKILLTVFTLMIVFHLLILSGAIPFNMVWGGRLNNRAEMLQFESVSIVMNALMMTIVLWRMGRIKWGFNATVLRVLFWLMFGLFVLNTLGNLASESHLEMLIFTPVTLILAICCLRVALEKE